MLVTTIEAAMKMFKKSEITFSIMLKHVNEGDMLVSNNILKRGSKVNNKESSARTFAKEFTINVIKEILIYPQIVLCYPQKSS